MQFIINGPDIPDALLQAHEEGRVVFFCGAGISVPAGLPRFKGLVEQIYRLNGTSLSDIEQKAFDLGQYDGTLDLLERRLPGQRLAVRRSLAQALTPKLRRKGAIDTQAALLRLARSRDGALRLVTTNFDRIFHVAAKRTDQKFQAYSAPMLPIPKNSRWNGLVYLHGLLPEKVDDTTLNRLVVTSGDFGLAYLTERWAARFVSELFRNYVVCFVGYSINDPVLRYMMDALAADRMLGEVTPQAWALGDCELGQEQRAAIEWVAKGVTPILYNVPTGSNDHSALHKTLHAWAETYRDGVQGKEAIVVKHALARPQDSTRQDDFVGRMLWALSDRSGLPAKSFAEFNPVPSLDWLLETFSYNSFQHGDLIRFGVSSPFSDDAKMRFSLIRRPPPYKLAPPMLLASDGFTRTEWDNVMHHLARWLLRHLDDPRLVIWIAEQGGQLHNNWLWLIENELNRFTELERKSNSSELNEIRKHAPNAIPGPQMHAIWRILINGLVKSPSRDNDLFAWKRRLERDGFTATLRMELRNLLSPKIVLKKPFVWSDDLSSSEKPTRIKQFVDWEITLTASNVHYFLSDMSDEKWTSALPLMLEDIQQNLRDALDLLCELGEADKYRDRSHWDLPSISPHRQNRGFRDWVSLIELLRDSWLAVLAKNSPHATHIAQEWFKLPFPTFKRLALFAASKNECISSDQWVNWLVSDDAWWLWCIDSKREVLRLLVLQGQNLVGSSQDRIEAAIMAGPPRVMYTSDMDEEQWKNIADRSIWLHLAKLKSSGLKLGDAAEVRLASISIIYPDLQLEANESDEFSHWMSGTGDPDYEDIRDIDIAPRNHNDLVIWLTMPAPTGRPFYEDTWREVCRTRFFHSLSALYALSQEGVWPESRWRDALQTWSDEPLVFRSWKFAAPLVISMPDDNLQQILHGLTWWIESASKSLSIHESIFLELCRRVLNLEIEADLGTRTIRDGIQIENPVSSAINHPIGHVTSALLNYWFKDSPNDNDLVPDNLRHIFSSLCNVQVGRFRHARVLLCSRLIAFYRVDRAWTEEHLLQLFDWTNPVEAKSAWEGFLWSPRLYQPLLAAFKVHFLECANHYDDLGEHRQQYAAFLTYAALESIDGFSVDDFRTAIAQLPQEGLVDSAQALSQALGSAANQREDYWTNRVQPFWHLIWPKSIHFATPRIAESLARMAISARSQFPAALQTIQDWLLPIEYPDHVIHLLEDSGLCRQFPVEALHLISTMISDQAWPPNDLSKCLDDIVQASPPLAIDPEYLRLREFIRRR